MSLIGTLRYEFTKLLGMSHDGKRSLYDLYGYDVNIPFEKLYLYARRQGIANRITFGIARPCWRNGFKIINNDDPLEQDANIVLSDEINLLSKNGLLNKIERADVLNRIGKCSVLYVGVPDGRTPDQPIGTSNPNRLNQVYFKPFAYDGIEIIDWDNNPKSPRYGLPLMYQVSIKNRGQMDKERNMQTLKVHYSRIVHLVENALDSDIEGIAGLEPVFNRILDLDKTCGGSAEAFFRNAGPKIKFEIDPEFAADMSTEDKEDFDTAANKFTNDMQNMIRSAGAKVDSIKTPHSSPLDTVKVALWEISSYTGIPIRVLIGEGSGQLAGSEDKITMNAIISDRQYIHCAPIVSDVLDILATAKMIQLPDVYSIRFNTEEAHTEQEKAVTADKKAETIERLARAKSQPGGDDIDMQETAAALGIDELVLDGGFNE